MSMEEKLSRCILYNLRILQKAVRSTEQLDEVLVDGIFLKSNTNAFIHVTYFLFNIIDAKEFKKKFYWPIVDKRSENAYRTCSVEFINALIDRFGIQQEKIKQVTVVHPSGKKFMSLMLDLILIAIKEVMKRKRFNSSKSMDIERAMEVATTINQVENDLMSSLQSELRVIKEKTHAIQELLGRICPNNECEFEELIKSWHERNIKRMSVVRENNERIKRMFENAKLLQEKAEKMLADKKYEVVEPSACEMEKISEFYRDASDDGDGESHKLSIVSLIRYLQSTLPIILNYVKNVSFEEAEVSDEEMKIVRQKIVELEKFDPLIKRLLDTEKAVEEKLSNLRLQKEEEEAEAEDDSLMEDPETRMIKEAEEKETIKFMLSPRHHFDTSKSCMGSFMHKRNHLALAYGEDETLMERSMMLNQSRMLFEARMNRNQDKMGPPKLTHTQLPSRRKRRDAMELLEQATSKKFDLNSSKYNGNCSRIYSTPLSSTMLSPDLNNHRDNMHLNLSMISAISNATPIPKNVPVQATHNLFRKCDVLDAKSNLENLPLTGNQSSPVKSHKTVSLSVAFGEDLTDEKTQQKTSNLPKLSLNDETLKHSQFSNDSEVTICAKSNSGTDSGTGTTILRKKSDDEDLFNISDSILVTD